jgi:putative sigma-54 modulation protein
MELNIHGDKIKVTSAMKSYLVEKLEKLEKYLENSDDVRANVIVKVKGHEQTVEITIPLKSVILRSEETKEDFYAAVDKTIDKLERQIRKNKTRIMSRKNTPSFDFNFSSVDIEEEKTDEKKIVKRKTIEVKPMTEEEAILQMDLIDRDFFVYKDADTNNVNVVYKRKDGDYGVIETK